MISGAEDHAVPDISTRSTLKRIRQRCQFVDRRLRKAAKNGR
jgi:hypothetical protein